MRYFKKSLKHLNNKNDAFRLFRTNILEYYVKWFNGEMILYGQLPPKDEEKILSCSILENAILTWGKLHQEQKYLSELMLDKNSFINLNVLDLGSGGIPGGMIFKEAEIFCLDSNMNLYNELGYPLKYYLTRVHFISAFAENLPFKNNTFDAIISLNALDHFDNIDFAIKEIQRVAKVNCKIRLNISYHSRTILEPLELNDQIIYEKFKWCKNFNKINEKKVLDLRGDVEETLTLWSNFE